MQTRQKPAWIGSFQGLRFLVALLVVFAHTEMVPGHRLDVAWYKSAGAICVSFFFILSGFVVHRGYEKRLINGTVTPGTFLVGRLAHLWPLHVLMLLVCAYCYSGGKPSFFVTRPELYLNLLLLQSWVPGPVETFAFSLNGVAWTLSAEWLFYIAYLGLVRMKKVTRLRLTAALYAFIALCAGLASGGYLESVQHLFYTNPMFRLADFMLGIALCEAYGSWRERHEAKSGGTLRGTLAELAAVGFAAACLTADVRLSIPLEWKSQLLYAPACALVVFVFACGRGLASRLLSTRPMQYLGKLSMPMYLLHQWGIWLGMQLMGDVTGDYRKRTLLCLLIFVSVILAAVVVLHGFVQPVSKAILKAWSRLKGANMRMKKSDLIRKLLLLCVFGALISAPLFCLMIGIQVPVTLTNSEPEPRPEFHMQDVADGSFQKEFEAYWNSDFPNHHLLTKAYNQLRYSLFGEGTSVYVRGEDGQVHDINYIDEALCLDASRQRTAEDCNRYVDLLLSVSEKAKALGKKVAFVLTPNKVTFTEGTLPGYYRFAEPRYDTENAQLMRQVLRERNVPYVDGRAVLEHMGADPELPIFGKGGIHWTLNASAEALTDMLAQLNTQTAGVPVVPVEIAGHYETKTRRYMQDEDIWHVLNIWTKPEDRMVYPVLAEKEPVGNRDYPEILMQGGSFGFPLLDLLMETALAERIDFVYYEQTLYSWNYGDIAASMVYNQSSPIASFQDEQIRERLIACDWLILEINEAFLSTSLMDYEGVGSQYAFLKMADEQFSAMLEQGGNTAEVQADAGITEPTWTNFVPQYDQWMLMGRSRGTLELPPQSEEQLLELSIPWDSFEQFAPGYSHYVRVFVDGQEVLSLTPNGQGDQYAAVTLPAGTQKVEIFTSGMKDLANGEVSPTTVYYSLYARLKGGV